MGLMLGDAVLLFQSASFFLELLPDQAFPVTDLDQVVRRFKFAKKRSTHGLPRFLVPS